MTHGEVLILLYKQEEKLTMKVIHSLERCTLLLKSLRSVCKPIPAENKPQETAQPTHQTFLSDLFKEHNYEALEDTDMPKNFKEEAKRYESEIMWFRKRN
jgi:hypothetical protein